MAVQLLPHFPTLLCSWIQKNEAPPTLVAAWHFLQNTHRVCTPEIIVDCMSGVITLGTAASSALKTKLAYGVSVQALRSPQTNQGTYKPL